MICSNKDFGALVTKIYSSPESHFACTADGNYVELEMRFSLVVMSVLTGQPMFIFEQPLKCRRRHRGSALPPGNLTTLNPFPASEHRCLT